VVRALLESVAVSWLDRASRTGSLSLKYLYIEPGLINN
jgi:hypothetical protein